MHTDTTTDTTDAYARIARATYDAVRAARATATPGSPVEAMLAQAEESARLDLRDEPTPPATFEVGTTYTTRMIGDSDLVLTYTVSARTARFVTLTDRWSKSVRVGVNVDTEGEWARPEGSYSMAPTIRADRPA